MPARMYLYVALALTLCFGGGAYGQEPAASAKSELSAGSMKLALLLREPGTDLRRLLVQTAAGCTCGHQPYLHCINGQQYSFSSCQDSNGQFCGNSDVPTGEKC